MCCSPHPYAGGTHVKKMGDQHNARVAAMPELLKSHTQLQPVHAKMQKAVRDAEMVEPQQPGAAYGARQA